MKSADQVPSAESQGTEQSIRPPVLPYRPPLLRCHGALRDLTLQSKSGEILGSDLNLKENVVAVVWP